MGDIEVPEFYSLNVILEHKPFCKYWTKYTIGFLLVCCFNIFHNTLYWCLFSYGSFWGSIIHSRLFMFQNCFWCLSFTLKSLCSTLHYFTNGNLILCSLCMYVNCFHLFMPVASTLKLYDYWINNFSSWITSCHSCLLPCSTGCM